MVSEPTRGENTLNSFITDSKSRTQIIPGKSDHDGVVYIGADISPLTYQQKPLKIHLHKNADLDSLCNHLANFRHSLIELSNFV